jgi:hypothetical protein
MSAPAYTTGQLVQLAYHGQTIEARIEIVSANSRSLLLTFDGAMMTPGGGMMLGMMPLLMDDDGVYRDLTDNAPATLTP